MAANQFVPFGLSPGSYVMTPAAWAADPVRGSGYPPGKLLKERLNTAMRQSSSIATMIAQFIADNQAGDVLDDADLVTLKGQFIAALAAFSSSAQSNYRLSAQGSGGATKNVTLSAGNWQIALITFSNENDGGNLDATVSQNGIVTGIGASSVTTSTRFYRVGGAGFGRSIYGADIKVATFNVPAAGAYVLTLGNATVTGANIAQVNVRGAQLTLDKV